MNPYQIEFRTEASFLIVRSEQKKNIFLFVQIMLYTCLLNSKILFQQAPLLDRIKF